MKKLYPLLLTLILLPLLFTACDDDGYYYYDYDEYLVGQWELIYADGRPVSGYEVNYLDFYQDGNGYYYYYDRGTPYEMPLRWSVDQYYDGQVLYISYADGTQTSMDYWYNANGTRLHTSWYNGPYRHEYVYRLVQSFDWYNAPMPQSAGAQRTSAITRPGL